MDTLAFDLDQKMNDVDFSTSVVNESLEFPFARVDEHPLFTGLDDIINEITSKELTLGTEVYHVQLFDHNGRFYSFSSRHLVVYCLLLHPTLPTQRVVFKFRICTRYRHSSTFEIRYMTDEEIEASVGKTALLSAYCSSFNLSPNPFNIAVRTNKVFYGKIDGQNIWIEDYIPSFTKFWSDTGQHDQRMVGTSSAVLAFLQDFVYLESGCRHTVIDLQGGFFGNEYILCDVEFTDTMEVYGLLDTFVASVPYNERIYPTAQFDEDSTRYTPLNLVQ